jgi:citrate lyase beta subunit
MASASSRSPLLWTVPGPALLFCPGHRADRFDKALAAADGMILDLADAVGPGDKPAARAAVVEALDRDASDAPWPSTWEIADYGVLGDLVTVARQLQDEIVARKN